ncbi:MAG: hypothetical protein JKY56_01830 [Kofleriaceae bacterium]|nr:hypothetical protein [Kofleriaceae bacterium]
MRCQLILASCSLAIAGCSDSSKSVATDAPTGSIVDAAIATDAAEADAMLATEVVVRVFEQPGPVPIMYADADGNHVATLMTNADGIATISDMPAGGYVTAVVPLDLGGNATARGGPSPGDIDLATVAGVQLGDQLRFGTQAATMGTLSFTIDDQDGDSASYFLRDGCQNRAFASTSMPVSSATPIYAACQNADGTIDAIVVARTNDVNGYSVATGIPVSGSAPNLSAAATFDNWVTNMGTVEWRYTNTGDRASTFLQVRSVRNGSQYGSVSESKLLGSDESVTASRNLIDFFDGVVLWVQTGSYPNITARYDWSSIPAPGVSTTVALTNNDLMPVWTEGAVNFDSRTASTGLAMPPSCNGGAAVAVEVNLIGAAGTNRHTWKMLAPYGASLAYPELDGALSEMLWPSGLTESSVGMVVLTDTVHQYDEYRSRDLTQLDPGKSAREAAAAATVCMVRM